MDDFIHEWEQSQTEFEAIRSLLLIAASTLAPGDSFADDLVLVAALLSYMVSRRHTSSFRLFNPLLFISSFIWK